MAQATTEQSLRRFLSRLQRRHLQLDVDRGAQLLARLVDTGLSEMLLAEVVVRSLAEQLFAIDGVLHLGAPDAIVRSVRQAVECANQAKSHLMNSFKYGPTGDPLLPLNVFARNGRRIFKFVRELQVWADEFETATLPLLKRIDSSTRGGQSNRGRRPRVMLNSLIHIVHQHVVSGALDGVTTCHRACKYVHEVVNSVGLVDTNYERPVPLTLAAIRRRVTQMGKLATKAKLTRASLGVAARSAVQKSQKL